MNYPLIIGIESGLCFFLLVSFLLYRNKINNLLGENGLIRDQIEKNEERLSKTRAELVDSTNNLRKIKQEIESSKVLSQEAVVELERNKKELDEFLVKRSEQQSKANIELKRTITKFQEAEEHLIKIKIETEELQNLKGQKDHLEQQIKTTREQINKIRGQVDSLQKERAEAAAKKQVIMAKLDLYSRIEEFTSVGHYEEPSYLFETSERFAEEIKRIRLKQRELIKNKNAVTYPQFVSITSDNKIDQKILDGQIFLMLSSFNMDCDILIGKVKPSSYTRTLEQIDKLATKLEQLAATLHCGFNTEYVKLKYEECTLQYQHMLKKQEEAEEQRLIKERMREEVKAQKEYERAIAEAEKEEDMYRKMLERAKESLGLANEEERIIAQQRIEDLEKQLADAQQREERARSLAEQTRRGHVYVISNVGSFGKEMYKIGLTRRLDPLERVKELGDASVPFSFDVHAIIHAEDAPALEADLHRKFKHRRVNTVNYRKEFFRVSLEDIKMAIDEIVDNDVDFKMTALAEEYYESRRLQEEFVNS